MTDTTGLLIDRIGVETVLVPIVGTTPLLVHRWSEKAKQKMLDEMQGRDRIKENKDPEAEYEAAFYRFKDGAYGFPAAAFKQATVRGTRFYGKQLPMTEARQIMFFNGEIGVDGLALVRLEGEPHMRQDPVRVGRGGADLRYRPEFSEWSTVLDVTYVKSSLALNSLLSLIDAGGLGTGVGDWRPEKDGNHGTYRVDTTRDVEVIS